MLWTKQFLEAQGHQVDDNILHQDNKSAILLEKNGKASSSKRTRHLNIRYFFVTDQVSKGNLKIKFCPTDDMIADYFTKPTTGAKFHKLRSQVMNLRRHWRLILNVSHDIKRSPDDFAPSCEAKDDTIHLQHKVTKQ